MKSLVCAAAIALGAASSLLASVDGTVIDRTAGKPQAGVQVNLLKPGAQGMQHLGTVSTDAAGHFLFKNDMPGGGPQLLQASYQGVNYNKLLTPNVPTSNVELDVYESTKAASAVRVGQHMLVIQPSASQIAVDETLILENNSNQTFNNEALGGMRFYLPPAANGQSRASVQGPQGMPLPTAPERTNEQDIYKVVSPVKPGETEFQVSYVLPAGTPFKFEGRVVNIKGMTPGPLRLVAPAGVTLTGNDIQQVGQEPQTQAMIYNVTAPDQFSVDVSGIGSLQNGNNSADTSDEPPVTQANPQIYHHMAWLLALAFCILGVGLLMLYRSSPIRSPYSKTEPRA